MFKWYSNGEEFFLNEMTDSHLENAINFLKRRGLDKELWKLEEEKERRKEWKFFGVEKTCKYCGGIMKRCQIYREPEVGFQFDIFAFVCKKCGSQGPTHGRNT